MKLKRVAAMVLLSSSGFINAGTMGEINTAAPTPSFYIGVEAGGSVSLDTRFHPLFDQQSATFSTIAPSNSDWNTNFGTGVFGGLFAGYDINPNVAFQFTWDYRTDYDYFLHASYGYDTSDPNLFIEDDYRSVGDINIQTFLFDMVLKPTVNWGGFVPYVKAGIGFSYNEMSDIRNRQHTFASQPVNYDSNIHGDSVTSFAWDAGVGADYFFTNNVSFGLGYRFVDAGKLRTSNRFNDLISGLNDTITPFQTKNLYLNEVVASLAYHF